jgi:hypothetical protein
VAEFSKSKWSLKKENKMTYDSTIDTLKHIKRVNELLLGFAQKLIERAKFHDDSKLLEPEKSAFDIATPKLAGLTYGSEEYKAALADLGKALAHHYQHNTHHPEHYSEGIIGFDLLDLVEMFFDWWAATERHNDGDLRKSIEKNQSRFEYSDDLKAILDNTAENFGYEPKQEQK